MLLKIALGIFLKVASKALAKFGAKTDWELVKANVDEWIRNVIPGEIADDVFAMALTKVISIVQKIVSDAKIIAQFVELGKAKDYQGAYQLLKQLVLDAVLPQRDLAMNELDSLVLALEQHA